MTILLFDLSTEIIQQILGYPGLDTHVCLLWMTLSRPMQQSLERSTRAVAIYSRKTSPLAQFRKIPNVLSPFRTLKELCVEFYEKELCHPSRQGALNQLPLSLVKLDLRFLNSGDLLDIFADVQPYSSVESDLGWPVNDRIRTSLLACLPSLESLWIQTDHLARAFEPLKFPKSLTDFSFDLPNTEDKALVVFGSIPQWLLSVRAGRRFLLDSLKFYQSLPPGLTKLATPCIVNTKQKCAMLPRTLTSAIITDFKPDPELLPFIPPLLDDIHILAPPPLTDLVRLATSIPRHLTKLNIGGGIGPLCPFESKALRALPHGLIELRCFIALDKVTPSDFPPKLTSLSTEYTNCTKEDVKRVPPSLRILRLGIDMQREDEVLDNMSPEISTWFLPNVEVQLFVF